MALDLKLGYLQCDCFKYLGIQGTWSSIQGLDILVVVIFICCLWIILLTCVFQADLENFLRACPYIRAKFEAELAKMTPERRERVRSNQALIYANLKNWDIKLQQHQQQKSEATVGCQDLVKPSPTEMLRFVGDC